MRLLYRTLRDARHRTRASRANYSQMEENTEHLAIVVELAKGDGEGAARAMAHHIDQAANALAEGLVHQDRHRCGQQRAVPGRAGTRRPLQCNARQLRRSALVTRTSLRCVAGEVSDSQCQLAWGHPPPKRTECALAMAKGREGMEREIPCSVRPVASGWRDEIAAVGWSKPDVRLCCKCFTCAAGPDRPRQGKGTVNTSTRSSP